MPGIVRARVNRSAIVYTGQVAITKRLTNITKRLTKKTADMKVTECITINGQFVENRVKMAAKRPITFSSFAMLL